MEGFRERAERDRERGIWKFELSFLLVSVQRREEEEGGGVGGVIYSGKHTGSKPVVVRVRCFRAV